MDEATEIVYDDWDYGGPVDCHGNPVPYEQRAPSEIVGLLSRRVHGQEAAKRAAAMTVYHTLRGTRCTAVFAGPSGCGKSEIWRELGRIYPGLVRMIDFSRCQAAGWRGDLHLRDAFQDVDPDDVHRSGLILVLDEADKILCESAMGAGGTDYNQLLQNELLLLLDGDTVEFAEEDKPARPALRVDASRVSVVLLGAFERLFERKTAASGGIGFGAPPRTRHGYGTGGVTVDDLIASGCRREVAGRVQRIVQLRPLSAGDYRDILVSRVLPDVGTSLSRCITISAAAADALASQACQAGLGVRWMSSRVREALDEAIYEDPDASTCTIALRGGELRCCPVDDSGQSEMVPF